MKQVIYETKGRAREYNELAINLFTGCGHQCIYCYGADVTHQTRDAFENRPKVRVSVEDVKKSAEIWVGKGETRRILLCFVTDPYQPIEAASKLTRRSIEALHKAGLNVIILTKGGLRSVRDFDLLTGKDAYATTLTCLEVNESIRWEPFAGKPWERIEVLKEAYKCGIETWVSLEPVIRQSTVMSLVEATKDVVGHYKVGTMNYHPHAKTINWHDYGWQIKRFMDNLGVKYYFKKDLLMAMKVNQVEFIQTWVCG